MRIFLYYPYYSTQVFMSQATHPLTLISQDSLSHPLGLIHA